MELHELPYLADIHTALRKGRHLTLEDGPLYEALASHYDAFNALFKGLGLTLVCHERGFFYLEDDTAPKSAQRMVLFAAILVETLDDQGINLDQELVDVRIDPDKLPHLKHEKYRLAMEEVGVRDQDGLLKVLEAMKRYGLAEPVDGLWRFRTSAHRLLDVMNMAGRVVRPAEAIEPAAAEEGARL